MRFQSVILATVVVASLLPRVAHAELPLDLTWDAPEGCPASSDVVTDVGRLTQVPATHGRRRLTATGRVERTEQGRYRLVLETVLGDARDTKQVVGDSCEALAGSAAVALALRLDAFEETEPASEPVAPAPPPPEEQPPRSTAVAPRHAVPALWLGLGGAADISALPAPDVGGALRISVEIERVHVGVTGVYWVPRDEPFAGGGRGAFTWQTAAVAAGVDVVGGPWHLAPCLGMELGVMSAESSGVRAPGSTTELWAAAQGGARSAFDVAGGMRIALEATASVPLRRPEFVIEGRGLVHQPAPLGARFFLGAEWNL